MTDRKIFEGVKFLYPDTDWFIDLKGHHLWQVELGLYHGEMVCSMKESYTDHVLLWCLFEAIIRAGKENGEYLRLETSRSSGRLIFFNPKIGREYHIDALSVISNKTLKKEEAKVSERRYEVYDGSTLLSTDMDLDTAFCLIQGYSERYFNQRLNLTIKEIVHDEVMQG